MLSSQAIKKKEKRTVLIFTLISMERVNCFIFQKVFLNIIGLLLTSEWINKKPIFSLVYNYRNFKNKCGNNSFWNTENFYRKLALYRDEERTIRLESTKIKVSKVEEIESDESTGFFCENVIRRVLFKTVFNSSSVFERIDIELYIQKVSKTTEIEFSNFPIHPTNTSLSDFSQRNGGFEKNDFIKFGMENNISNRNYIKTDFPVSFIAFKDNNGDCLSSKPLTNLFKGKRTTIKFKREFVETCSITVQKDDLRQFCNNFKNDYKVFSWFKRYRKAL